MLECFHDQFFLAIFRFSMFRVMKTQPPPPPELNSPSSEDCNLKQRCAAARCACFASSGLNSDPWIIPFTASLRFFFYFSKLAV